MANVAPIRNKRNNRAQVCLLQLGLTATPRRDVNADTYDYFGEPVYTYALRAGINDGFLTPYRVKDVRTTIDEYTYTPDDDVEDGELESGRTYTEHEINRDLVIEARERYRVQLLLQLMRQREKTLVFGANQAHAALLRDLINQEADSPDPNYCHRVTADDGELSERHLREFQDNERSTPTVLTTSQKLSTGVDAPQVRNIVLLRPVKSMVEFKQIVGRGTRLADGKDYFTIYDFVRAYEHFRDPEWDGEAEAVEEVTPFGKTEDDAPANAVREDASAEPPCPTCANAPCVCDVPERRVARVRLSDGKVRELDAMVHTSFYTPSGAPVSAEAFVRQLFGELPAIFGDEVALRRLWSQPDTRRRLLEELAERGYTRDQLADLQRLVHGEDADLYDVLAYVAYHATLVPRAERAAAARIRLADYDPAQRAFLNFVLEQYVRAGVGELDDKSKL